MVRLYIVMFHFVAVLFMNFFFNGDVSIKINAPGQINAGTERLVEITINKGKITGFSRFQIELPAGITATNVYSANADFSFKDQKIRLVWLRLSNDDTISVKFNIQCNERLKGDFDITGKFSYIDNNDRKSLDVQPQNVVIVPSTTLDPRLIVDIKDFGKSAPALFPSSEGQVACVRQRPAYSDLNKEYTVTLLVNKESLQKFAKIEEVVPAGYTAVNVDSKDGIFTFRDNKAKFLWMTLPAEPYFTVSYKLVPLKDMPVKQPVIGGTFSYILEDKTQSVPVIEKDVSLANLTPELVKSILQAEAPALIASAEPVKNTSSSSKVAIGKSTEPVKTVTKTEPIKVAAGKTTDTSKTVSQVYIKEPIKTVVNDETIDLLKPQTGIYFRVQIAAGHKPVNVKSYFKKYKLESTIIKEQHEGWIKYSIGSFAQYRDARDYRVHIWNTTTLADAFVSAYNSGKRITVQEALMVGNQGWLK